MAGPTFKTIALGALVVALSAVVAYAVVREFPTTKQADAQVVGAPMGEHAQRPAMSAAEERYA